MYIHFRLDSERHLDVLFIGDGDVYELHQFPHHLGRRLAPFPKILAVIEIAGNRQTALARRLHGLQGERRGRLADGRGDARDVEPAGAREHLAPIDIARFGQRNRAVVAVVDHARSSLVGAGFQEIDPHPPLAPHDRGGIDTEAPDFGDGGIAEWVLGGQHGDECRRQAEIRQRHSHVGLTAAEGRLELWTLQKTLAARRREAQHDLTESNRSSCHRQLLE